MIAYRCLWSVNKAGGKRWSFSSAAEIFYRVTRERFSHYRWIRRFSNYSLHSRASKLVIDFSLCLNLSILCRRIIQAEAERKHLVRWMSRVDWMRGNKQAWKEKRKNNQHTQRCRVCAQVTRSTGVVLRFQQTKFNEAALPQHMQRFHRDRGRYRRMPP